MPRVKSITTTNSFVDKLRKITFKQVKESKYGLFYYLNKVLKAHKNGLIQLDEARCGITYLISICNDSSTRELMLEVFIRRLYMQRAMAWSNFLANSK